MNIKVNDFINHIIDSEDHTIDMYEEDFIMYDETDLAPRIDGDYDPYGQLHLHTLLMDLTINTKFETLNHAKNH